MTIAQRFIAGCLGQSEAMPQLDWGFAALSRQPPHK